MNVSTEYDLNMKLQKEYENMIRMNNTASTLKAVSELECQLEKKYGYKQEELFAIWDDAEAAVGVVQ